MIRTDLSADRTYEAKFSARIFSNFVSDPKASSQAARAEQPRYYEQSVMMIPQKVRPREHKCNSLRNDLHSCTRRIHTFFKDVRSIPVIQSGKKLFCICSQDLKIWLIFAHKIFHTCKIIDLLISFFRFLILH